MLITRKQFTGLSIPEGFQPLAPSRAAHSGKMNVRQFLTPEGSAVNDFFMWHS